MVALAECGTHAIFDAVSGPYATSENALSAELLDRLTPGMLCLADRGFYSFTAWQTAAATDTDLLWRVRDNLKLDAIEDLPDGSYLAEVFDSRTDRKRERVVHRPVVEYTIEDSATRQAPTGC